MLYSPEGSVSDSFLTVFGVVLFFQNKSNQIVPEHTVELRGAGLAWASKDKSSKKHVVEVRGPGALRGLLGGWMAGRWRAGGWRAGGGGVEGRGVAGWGGEGWGVDGGEVEG